MERTLVSTMIDQVRSGKLAESGFKEEAWVASVDQVEGGSKAFYGLVTMKTTKDKLDNLKGK